MKKSIHVKEYTRKKHGRAKFGGKVSSHNKSGRNWRDAELSPKSKQSMAEAEGGYAYLLGKQAFKAGKKRIPRADKDLMKLMDDIMNSRSKDVKTPGVYTEVLQDWLKGWDEANLKLPVYIKEPFGLPQELTEAGKFRRSGRAENPTFTETDTDDLSLPALDGFTGTQNYYNVMGVQVTDGVEYIMRNGYSWFVTDALINMRMKKKLKAEPFLTVDLKRMKDGERWKTVISDGNENILNTQVYDFTDAKKEIKLFYTNNVLMLDGEY